MSYSPQLGVHSVSHREYKGKASGFWPVEDNEEIEKEHNSCDLLFFEPHVMYLQFIKSKPHCSPRKWRLGEIK